MKIAFWITTGLLSLLMCYSAGMYFLNHEAVVGYFQALGYPTYLIYPLAVLKLLGILALLTRKSRMLMEWAYAGFALDFSLALAAHWVAQDGGHVISGVALLLLISSRFFEYKWTHGQ